MKRFLLILLSYLIFSPGSAQELDMDLFKGMKARNLGPGGMSGRVTAIDVQRNNTAVIYVGTASGGVWKSENGGVNFKPIFEHEAIANIGSIAIDPRNPDIIWVGTGEGNPRNSLNGGYGIYKSMDGGKSWKLMGLVATRHIHRIIVHPDNSNIIYAGAIGSPWGPHPERGVYKSTDGGETWSRILYVNELTGAGDLVMDPVNPEKLFAAMWEHQRWPWFFKSGGPGSGLYMTVDGGENWKKITDKDGLPEGELGRIGLAIAAGNTKYVYALIESKKNALYRSTDGGYKWEKRGDENIGNRPFYYSDIFVDPENENRLYTLYSEVNVSEDGGKSFRTLIGQNIHSDHHAWYIHPDDPSFMIDGNDGGMAVTHDMGENWRHVTNLPVSQFYHVRVDMDLPYNVYGGMQDNGSWKGPGYVWSNGGIVNTYWEFLIGGDGFDALPVPGDLNTCYAMSQQGNVARINLKNGESIDIKPVGPENVFLRFHWNAAIAQDPFDNNTIYFGSQFLHKSTDRGDSWEIISPDLSTNDSSKQHFLESGGLTYDVTGAETHTCIIAIAPSPVDRNVIWVGTDDGNVQLTTDGGKKWKNLSPLIKEMPHAAWIPHIVPSGNNAGEAFVVVNNYRQNDYAPYLFHTRDYGKKWERLVAENDVDGYALSFAQDPDEPSLQFLGTEAGLYISIDGGEKWTKWTNGFPTVSTMDLAIHPRELDLVIGTFGRSAFVLDDIRPLRELARNYEGIIEETVHLFEPPQAYLVSYKNAPGYYFTGDSYFQGENRDYGAMLTFFVKKEESHNLTSQDSVTINILDKGGIVIRHISLLPENGINRYFWRLDGDGVRVNTGGGDRRFGRGRAGGGPVLPGDYQVKILFRDDSTMTNVSVYPDPRTTYDLEAMIHRKEKVDSMMLRMKTLNKKIDLLLECEKRLELIGKIAGDDAGETFRNSQKVTKDSINVIKKYLFRDNSKQGLYRPPDAFYSKIYEAYSIIRGSSPMTPNEQITYDRMMGLMDDAIARIDNFMNTGWKNYRDEIGKEDISFFED